MNRIIVAALLVLTALPSWAATCKISEYRIIGRDQGGQYVMVANEPALTVQEVTYTTSTQSAKFNADTAFIRIVCDAKAHFEFGTAPTAAATDPYLPADTPEYFGVPQGGTENFEVAFYDGSS